MTQSVMIPEGVGALKKEPLPLIWPLFWFFAFGSVALTFMPGWSLVVHVVGIVMAVFFAIFLLRARIGVAPEVIAYFLWVAWSLLAVFYVRSTVLFWEDWLTILQVWGLIFITSCFVAGRRTFSLTMSAVIVGAAVTGFYGVFVQRGVDVETSARMSGLVGNANGFSWLMVMAVVAMAYFWMLPSRHPLLKYTLLSCGMAAATLCVFWSGSRMGTVGLMGFFLAWFWFCYRKIVLRRPQILLVVVAAAIVFVIYFGQSLAGERFRTGLIGLMTGTEVGGANIRLELLQQAWDLIVDYPITGVGLSNFLIYSQTHNMAHSEYAEVAATTGLPGLVLYLSILVFLWLRAGRLKRYSMDRTEIGVAGLTRALIAVIAVTDLANLNYHTKVSWIILGALVGFTMTSWRGLVASKAGQPRGIAAPGYGTSSPRMGPDLLQPAAGPFPRA